MTDRTESTLYSSILEGQAKGLEIFEAEDFKPLSGTVLLVIPPKIEKKGSIDLPQTSFEDRNFGRIAAVPDDPGCPVKPGDWVVFREGSPLFLNFRERTDLAIMSYCEGPASDLLGWFDGEKFRLDVVQDEE